MIFDLVMPIKGFENLKQVELEKIDDIFMQMRDLDNKYISFTLIDPFVLRDYDFEVPTNIQELLEIDENSNILVQNIVLLQKPIEDSMVNFIGPLLFNTDTKKAAQIILSESNEYGVAEKISNFLKK